ncbi:hypothetical protein [Candidatus Clostridium helianthi]|uniref:DUF2726 domain-containing protein n=1 Tax=Candidatus Clostridium helianthi TaxID=3381660 RepID=A0ABW8RZY3_9CLOT
MRKRTHEEFVREVYNLVGDEYEVLGKYEASNTKIAIKHTPCKHEYDVTPSSFLCQGTRCPICHGNTKKTTEQFKQEVYNIVSNEYEVLGEYINNSTKVKMRHTTCGHVYEVIPTNFIYKGRRCPECFGNQKKDTEQFKKEVHNLVGDEYEVLGEYENTNTKIKMRHTICGHEYDVTPSKFINGRRCPECFGNQKKDTEQFKQEVYNLVGDEYEVLGEYENTNTKIKMRHTTCGHEYDVIPFSFLKGNRCPKCSESKGEKKISETLTLLLDINKYDFNRHYSISDCRDKAPLPFDNFIKQGDNLLALIEYDGIQHFKPVKWSSSITDEEARKNLKDVQRRDRIKTNYCKNHGIPLIRIRHWEFDNIEEILTRELNELEIIQIDNDKKIEA